MGLDAPKEEKEMQKKTKDNFAWLGIDLKKIKWGELGQRISEERLQAKKEMKQKRQPTREEGCLND